MVKEFALTTRLGHGRRFLLAAFAVLLVGAALNAALGAGTAEAKVYPAVEERIEQAISKGRTWVDFGTERIPWAEAYKAFDRVACKKASYLVKTDSCQVWRMRGDACAFGMKVKYRNAEQRKALNAKVAAMMKKVSRRDSQSEKVEKIHDAIVKRCSYDYTSYRRGRLRIDSGNEYGCLVRGRSVCAGYAKAFQLVALKAGLKSRYVCNGDHAWNLVRVRGKWYHIDVCWDDTGGEKRKYFLKGSKAMAKYKYHTVKDCYPSEVLISKKDYIEPLPPVEEIAIDEPVRIEDPVGVDEPVKVDEPVGADDAAKADDGLGLGSAVMLKDSSQDAAAANDASGSGTYMDGGNAR